jgi:hypothetical protein
MAKQHSTNPKAIREMRHRHARMDRAERMGARRNGGVGEQRGRGVHEHGASCLTRFMLLQHELDPYYLCTAEQVPEGGTWGPGCTRRAGHPGTLHIARTYSRAEVVARWHGGMG